MHKPIHKVGIAHPSNSGRIILYSFLCFFVVFGLRDILEGKLTALDQATAVILISLFLVASRKFKISSLTAIVIGSVFLPNMIGHMGGYNLDFFAGHFDKAVHIVTAFLCSVAIITFSEDNFPKKQFIHVACVAFLLTITFGAAVEVSEYWGFIYIGFGEGYLGFGSGDNSQNFGPWEDSSLDTTCNILGSILGILTTSIWYRRGQKTERYFKTVTNKHEKKS